MIPIYKPFLEGNEKEYLIDCIDSTWISSQGKYIELFESAVKNYVNRKFASSCSNGTTALDLAFRAIELKPGDEVITPSFTYVASTNSVLANGGVPVFVDVEKDSWNIDSELIETKITSKTRAILVSNIYGYLPDFDSLKEICKKHNLYLIEDAAESFGATYKGEYSGAIGDISTFSFFGNKTITTGEGGMVLTDDKKLYDRIQQLKNQGNSTSRRYYHEILGFNYRMTNIQAAIGLAQFEQLEYILQRKKEIFTHYFNELDGKVSFQKPLNDQIQPSYWIVTILFKDEAQMLKVKSALEENDIDTRPLFYPVDKLDFYQNADNLPITEEIYTKGICLPSYPGLTDSELKLITDTVKNSL